MNVIQAAQKHAQAQTEQSPYEIELTLYDGSQLQGHCGLPDSGVVRMVVVDADQDEHILFINIDHVMSAQVINVAVAGVVE